MSNEDDISKPDEPWHLPSGVSEPPPLPNPYFVQPTTASPWQPPAPPTRKKGSTGVVLAVLAVIGLVAGGFAVGILVGFMTGPGGSPVPTDVSAADVAARAKNHTPKDPGLAMLWEKCDTGDMRSCDDLYNNAPYDSLEENFGLTCGARTDPSVVDDDISEECVTLTPGEVTDLTSRRDKAPAR